MAGNDGGSNSRGGGASISAAATAIGSAEARIQQPERQRRWGGCWGGFSCFGPQKGGKRIVPSSRIPEGNTSANRTSAPQAVGLNNVATTLAPSLLAPPSSPASFTNSGLPSTVQSPNNFLSLSANSPGDPSSAMFARGPYAHETQLVSPPVPSTITTEPSTAPLTPPPESSHLTTPSSPDVPYAKFLSPDLKSAGKSSYTANDLQATYPLYPGSPASSLVSPISRTPSSFPEREFPVQWDTSISNPRSGFSMLFGPDLSTSKNFMLPQDSSFFHPATSAQFYLDQAQQYSAGRLSLSKETDVYSSNGNGHQSRHTKNCKSDVEEIEAYRASFGFSADEIVTTPHYVEISDVHEEVSFAVKPFSSNYLYMEEGMIPGLSLKEEKAGKKQTNLIDHEGLKLDLNPISNIEDLDLCNGGKDCKSQKASGDISESNEPNNNHVLTDEEDLFSRMGDSRASKRYEPGLSISDAEIDYRSNINLKEGKEDFGWGE